MPIRSKADQEGEAMNKVKPIKDKDILNEIVDNLRKENPRDCLLFLFGFCCGPRISEMLGLRVIDVKNKDVVKIKATKNNRNLEVPIPKILKKELKVYCKDKEIYEYLFESRQGGHISRQRASQIAKKIAEQYELEEFNTHSLRKTFAHMLYEKTKDIALVQMALGHQSPVTTIKYLGLEEEYLKQKLDNFNPFD